MIIALSPNQSLTAVLSGAAATTNPTYCATWRTAGSPSDEVSQPVGSLAGATAVTLVSAPTDGQKIVESVQIYNGDTAAVVITFSKVTSGTGVTLFTYSIPVGYTLRWTEAGGISLTATVTPTGVGAAAGTGTTASEGGDGLIHKTTITLNSLPVTVANTTGVSFGGTKFYDFPAGRILVLGVTASSISFGLTDSGNVTPIDAADGGDLSIGSTAPTDGTLTGSDVDLLPSTSIDPLSGGVTGAALAAAAQFDGTTSALDAFFNILIDDADVGDGASDVLLVSASVVIHWINLGDY